MECPVCYTNECNCKLVCGHSFCKSCIKDWYVKTDSTPTCPMCRSNMYFKGMSKIIPKWEQEFEESKWEEIYSDAIEGATEDADTFAMFLEDLETVYKNITKLHDVGYEFSWEFIREIMNNPYYYLYIGVGFPRREMWDTFDTTWKNAIFVSRYPYWNGKTKII